MHVLVCGCDGFIGRHLVEKLAAKGLSVVGADRAVEDRLEGEHLRFKKADVLTQEGLSALQRYLEETGVRELAVAHLVGAASVGDCQRNGLLAHDLNVRSLKNIVALAARFKGVKVVLASTALVYGTGYKDLVDETFAVKPESTYARSKLEAEELLRNAAAAGTLRGVALRFSNLYGPGMNGHTLVATALKQMAGGTLALKEYLSVRDYVYIEDAVEALTAALISECRFETYNVSTAAGYSVRELVGLIEKVLKKRGLVPAETPEEKKSFPGRLVLSYDRIQKDLGWKPAYPLERGLERMSY